MVRTEDTWVCARPEPVSPSFTNESLIFLWGTIPPLSTISLLHTLHRSKAQVGYVPQAKPEGSIPPGQSDCVRNTTRLKPGEECLSRTRDRGALSSGAASFTERTGSAWEETPRGGTQGGDRGDTDCCGHSPSHGWSRLTQLLRCTSQCSPLLTSVSLRWLPFPAPEEF